MYPLPRFPFSNPFLIKIQYVGRFFFQRFLVANFGVAFMVQIMNSPMPVVLPIITYGQEWNVTIYILI